MKKIKLTIATTFEINEENFESIKKLTKEQVKYSLENSPIKYLIPSFDWKVFTIKKFSSQEIEFTYKQFKNE